MELPCCDEPNLCTWREIVGNDRTPKHRLLPYEESGKYST